MGAADGTRNALIVASYDYADPGLKRLRAPASDARALEAVLRDPEIGGFEVRTLLNEPAHVVSLAVEEFFADRRPDDLLVLHFSCHGVKDEDGELYFAASNTVLRALGATAVAADFVNRRMNRSRSRRVVLLLDCCYAGAFERGMTPRADTGIAIEAQFNGRGRAVITASSAMEYAFEGDQLTDGQAAKPSVFTSALVEGLQTGEADRDQDGMVALDELYDYVYDRVRAATPNQTPGKWVFGVQGDLYIARRARPVTTPAELPPELQEAIDSPFAAVRVAAVQELGRVLRGRHAGLALAARQSLDGLLHDDSRMVAAAASGALGASVAPPLSSPTDIPAPVREELLAPPIMLVDPEPVLDLEGESARIGISIPPNRPGAQADASVAAASLDALLADPTSDPFWPVTAAERRAMIQQGTRLILMASGGLAVIGAVIAFLSLFSDFLGGFYLATLPANLWSVIIRCTLAFVAGICTFLPRLRPLTAAGFLLGAVATAPNAAIYDLTLLIGERYGLPGNGLWLDLAGFSLLLPAGFLAGVAVMRTGAVRIAIRRPLGDPLPWLVGLLGLAGAVALFVGARSGELLPGRNQPFIASEDLAPLIWASAMALVIPVVAAIVTPRKFGVALLAGWIGCGAAVAAFGTGIWSAFSLTLLALAVAIIPFSRAAPPDRQSAGQTYFRA